MKKLTVFALSVLLVLTAFAASALELENVQQAQEQALPEQPAALTAAAPVPGLNIFTGTVNPVDFENGSNLGSWWIADATTVNRDVVDNAQQQAGTGNSTKVLRLTAQSVKEYFRTISNNYALFTGRRYEFKLDTHIENFRDSGDLRMNIQQITTAESPSNSYYQSNDAAWKAAEKERKWHTQTLNFTVLNGTGTDLRIQWRVSNGTAVSNVTVYMDNISVIPYYNITYKIPSGDKVEYALRDEEGNLLTVYEPLMTGDYKIADTEPDENGQFLRHIGWSTTENASESMTSIPLANTDFTLYPVYQTMQQVTVTYTLPDGTVTDTAAKPVDGTAEYAPLTTGEYYISGTANLTRGIISTHIGWATTENAADAQTSVTLDGTALTLYPVYEKKALYHPAYGELLWYQNFTGKDVAKAAYANAAVGPYTFYSPNDVKSNFSFVNTDKGVSLKAVPALTTQIRASFKLDFTDGISGAGEYKFLFDSYFPTDLATAASAFKFVSSTTINSSGKDQYSRGYDKAGVWNTVDNINAYTLTVDDKLNGYKIFTNTIAASDYMLFDNICVYRKAADTAYVLYTDADGAVLGSAVAADGKVIAPAALGADIADFVCWIDADGNTYFAGDSITAAELAGKTFKAYCQVWANAMGFAYEGDFAKSDTLHSRGAFQSGEITTDGGRTVLHITAGGNSSGEAGVQLHMNNAYGVVKGNRIDGTQYNILKYTLKADNWTTETGTPSTAAIRLYYFKGSNYDVNFFSGTSLSNGVAVTPGAYQTVEVNLKNVSGWTSSNEISGFRFDTMYFGSEKINTAETYVDSLRVYRSGVLTVTYDSNLPAGTETFAHTDVPADTGRGVGSGYYLTDEHPTLEGYRFVGWALTPDAAAADVVRTVDLKRDTTVYAVWKSDAPEMLDKYSIRFGANKGLRFAATVDLELRKNEQTEEYGFLVTRKTLLQNKNATGDSLKVATLTSDTVGKTGDGVVFVIGRAWKNDGSVDIIYDRTGDKLDEESIKNEKAIGITTVLTDIPAGYYDDVFVVRSYVKISGTYYYGEVRENSYYAVAKAIQNDKDKYNDLTEDQKAEIETVIKGVENRS